MLRMLFGAVVVSVAMTGVASADEVFATRDLSTGEALPDMYYEVDLAPGQIDMEGDNIAGFAFQDGSARFYIVGLAGAYPGRTEYEGGYVRYGVEADETGCPSGPVVDHTGQQVAHWGDLEIKFSSDSEFVMTVGECDGPIDSSEAMAGTWK